MMRDEKTMMKLILQMAENDERIRGVILNGSRTSPSAKKDSFQDYDIVYIVNDVKPFVNNQEWINHFGEILIMQQPDKIDDIWPKNTDSYTFLMLFKDWNRIDLTFVGADKFETRPQDSHTLVLLDKDNSLGTFPPPSDSDYLPTPPTQKQFADCCNEFLWVSTYVAKGIGRKELTYAKFMAEHNVKEKLIELLIWYAGIKTDFSVPIGKCGKHLEKFIAPDIWEQFKKTYVDADYHHMWEGLFQMCEIFNKIALVVSKHYGYSYNAQEQSEVVKYLDAHARMLL